MASSVTTVVFTDGATSNNGRENPKGGLGVYFGLDDPRNLSEEFTDSPTNQRCELMAIMRAIQLAGPCDVLLIKTDSKYSIGCLREWVVSWESNGYLNSKGEPVKNAEIIQAIRNLMQQAEFEIKFQYVKGHSTENTEDAFGNQMADRLAVTGRENQKEETIQNLANFHAIPIELCHPKAQIPRKGTVQSAGFDLYSVEDRLINPGRHACIETGIKIIIPEGCYGRIAPRSGLAFRNQIDTLAGVVDRDYRNTLKVILQNLSNEDPFEVKEGDRIAQLIIEKICEWPLVQVESINDSTVRGQGGFGSTGKR